MSGPAGRCDASRDRAAPRTGRCRADRSPSDRRRGCGPPGARSRCCPPGRRLCAGRRRDPSPRSRGSRARASRRRSRYACRGPPRRCRCDRCRGGACSGLRLVRVLEVEGGDETSEADELSRDESELDDLRVREMRAQLPEEVVVELVMILGHQGREAEGDLLAWCELSALEVGERRHHRLRHALPHRRCGPRALSGRAVVQGRDLEAHQLLELGVENALQAKRGIERPVRLECLWQVPHGLEDGGVLAMTLRLVGQVADDGIETLGRDETDAGHGVAPFFIARLGRRGPARGALRLARHVFITSFGRRSPQIEAVSPCQWSRRFSSRAIRLYVPIARRARMISTMKMPVVSKVPEARARRKPRPYWAASISPTTEAVRARAMEMRSPEKIQGMHEGRTTRRVTKRGEAPIVLTEFTRSRSTFCTPT